MTDACYVLFIAQLETQTHTESLEVFFAGPFMGAALFALDYTSNRNQSIVFLFAEWKSRLP